MGGSSKSPSLQRTSCLTARDAWIGFRHSRSHYRSQIARRSNGGNRLCHGSPRRMMGEGGQWSEPDRERSHTTLGAPDRSTGNDLQAIHSAVIWYRQRSQGARWCIGIQPHNRPIDAGTQSTTGVDTTEALSRLDSHTQGSKGKGARLSPIDVTRCRRLHHQQRLIQGID